MNVLTIPASGSILFDNGTAGGSTNTSLTAATELSYDGTGGIDITSYVPGNTDRFNVRGTSGTLFSVSDALTGTVFSVNDASGLPIIEVNSDEVTDTVAIGEFGTNAIFVSGGNVGIGTNTPDVPLRVNGALIAGNSNNVATGTDASVLGGSSNCATGARSAIIGGNGNCASGPNSFVGGGNANCACAGSAFVATGQSNRAAGYRAIVGTGYNNNASGNQSGIFTGYANTSSSYSTAILTGYNNSSGGYYSSVITGYSNSAGGYYSTVITGSSNTANGQHSVVVNGVTNCAAGSRSVVLGADSSTVSAAHSRAVIAGGSSITSVSANMLHTGRLYIDDLPTSDPGVDGVIWEDNGLLTTGAGGTAVLTTTDQTIAGDKSFSGNIVADNFFPPTQITSHSIGTYTANTINSATASNEGGGMGLAAGASSTGQAAVRTDRYFAAGRGSGASTRLDYFHTVVGASFTRTLVDDSEVFINIGTGSGTPVAPTETTKGVFVLLKKASGAYTLELHHNRGTAATNSSTSATVSVNLAYYFQIEIRTTPGGTIEVFTSHDATPPTLLLSLTGLTFGQNGGSNDNNVWLGYRSTGYSGGNYGIGVKRVYTGYYRT
ncbi:hypothetical protein N9Z65_00430 [bacterium]|nr:hypothetical protein [bacterium]